MNSRRSSARSGETASTAFSTYFTFAMLLLAVAVFTKLRSRATQISRSRAAVSSASAPRASRSPPTQARPSQTSGATPPIAWASGVGSAARLVIQMFMREIATKYTARKASDSTTVISDWLRTRAESRCSRKPKTEESASEISGSSTKSTAKLHRKLPREKPAAWNQASIAGPATIRSKSRFITSSRSMRLSSTSPGLTGIDSSRSLSVAS